MSTEVLIPNKDEDGQDQRVIERGVRQAEDWANGKLVALLDGEYEQQAEETDSAETQEIPAQKPEGGKALYGAFDEQIRFAGGLSIKGVRRGRDIVRYRQGRQSYVGGQVLRIYPGGY